jgi:hypothetical protein
MRKLKSSSDLNVNPNAPVTDQNCKCPTMNLTLACSTDTHAVPTIFFTKLFGVEPACIHSYSACFKFGK